jgi:branched-subunit amino acid transport protein
VSGVWAVAVLLAAGAVSWALRIAVITLWPAPRLPAAVRRVLAHAAPAAIAAILGAGIAGGAALPDLASRMPVLAGAVVTAAFAWWRRGLVLPVAAGLLAAWALSAL